MFVKSTKKFTKRKNKHNLKSNLTLLAIKIIENQKSVNNIIENLKDVLKL